MKAAIFIHGCCAGVFALDLSRLSDDAKFEVTQNGSELGVMVFEDEVITDARVLADGHLKLRSYANGDKMTTVKKR